MLGNLQLKLLPGEYAFRSAIDRSNPEWKVPGDLQEWAEVPRAQDVVLRQRHLPHTVRRGKRQVPPRRPLGGKEQRDAARLEITCNRDYWKPVTGFAGQEDER